MADPTSKADLDFVRKVLAQKRVLVVDPTSSTRNSLRKIICDMGVPSAGMTAVDNFGDGLELLEKLSPEIVIVENDLNGKSGVDLVRRHLETSKNLLETYRGVTTSKATLALASYYAEEQIDCIITKPFTAQGISNAIAMAILQKAKASKIDRQVEESRQKLESGNLAGAMKELEDLLAANETSTSARYYSAVAKNRAKENDGALALLMHPIVEKTKHYRSLMLKVELHTEQNSYAKAYEAAKSLREKFPINPARVPLFVKLAVSQRDFVAIRDLANMAELMGESTEDVKMPVSAGLVLSGRFLLQEGNEEEALKALRLAIVLSPLRPKIVRRALVAAIRAGHGKYYDEWTSKLPPSVLDHAEVQCALLEKVAHEDSPAATVELGNKMMQMGIEDPELYVLMIAKSREVGRKEGVIDELIEKAKCAFPNEPPDRFA